MSNFSIISSLNITTIILLWFSVFVFWQLIYAKLKETQSNFVEYIINNDNIRSPFGYTLVAIGFIIRIITLLPLPLFGEMGRLDLVEYWEFYVKAFSQFFSSIFVFVGIALLMWPTLKKYYVLFTKSDKIDNKKISIYYLLSCLLLFVFGVLLHEGLVLLLM